MDFQKELIAEYDREAASTRKILEAIPEDFDPEYRPHAKSMKFGRLAGHVAETTGEWAMHTLTTEGMIFEPGHKFEPYVPVSKAALLERFDKEVAEVKAALASIDPAKWDETWKMGADGQIWIEDTKYRVWRVWVTPVHCEGGGTCPTYEVHITASDGIAGVCTQRVALN